MSPDVNVVVRLAGARKQPTFEKLLTILLLTVAWNAVSVAQPTRPVATPTVELTRWIPVVVTNPCVESHHFRITSSALSTQFAPGVDAFFVGGKSTQRLTLRLRGEAKLEKLPTVEQTCLDCEGSDRCASSNTPLVRPVIEPLAERGESSRLTSPRLSARAAQIGQHDVGVIAQPSGICPVGSEHLYISMDDEDNNNQSYVSGWTGEITHYSTGTTFGFCRVDGDLFHSFPWGDYAVLQLGTTCPSGANAMTRLFDNEHNGNNNWVSGNISPNASGTTQTELHFCYFKAGQLPTMTVFPNLYVPYGVFAAPPSLVGMATGFAHTDDEDVSNGDRTQPADYNFAKIIVGVDCCNAPINGKNTELHIAQVSNSTCNINPCPYVGTYDGENCQVGQAPLGTTPFIYANNFYYTPVNGNQCPRPGSWFDSRNCFVMSIPPQTTPFIWYDWWYVEPVCRP